MIKLMTTLQLFWFSIFGSGEKIAAFLLDRWWRIYLHFSVLRKCFLCAAVLCTEPRWMECTGGEREEVKKKVPQKVSVGVQTSVIRNMLASFFAPTQASACGRTNDTWQDGFIQWIWKSFRCSPLLDSILYWAKTIILFRVSLTLSIGRRTPVCQLSLSPDSYDQVGLSGSDNFQPTDILPTMTIRTQSEKKRCEKMFTCGLI